MKVHRISDEVRCSRRAYRPANGFEPDGDIGLHRLIVFLVLMGLPFCAHGALVWEARELEVEGKANEREVVGQYRFRNAGSAPVAITEIVSSCDCTTVELNKRTYGPGEEGAMTARLAVGERSGLQENTFAVITDDAGGEPIVLRLRAKIRSLLTLSAPVLSWKVGAEPEENSLIVTAASPLRIASLAIAGTYPAGRAEAWVETVVDGAQYRVGVRPASLVRTLNLTVSCVATFADGSTQTFAIHGMARK